MFLKIKTIILIVFTFSVCNTKVLGQNIKIDHVICVVKDLQKSVEVYENAGFNVKKGRLHKNGLINAHIKFKNKSSFELMSLQGTPGDAIAKNYENLLKQGEGGVFIAITGCNTKDLKQKLSNTNIPYEVIKTLNWAYVTFPDTSSLAHFFFIDYNIEVKDNIEIFAHSNQSEQIKDIYIEGDEKVLTFLKTIGLKLAGTTNDSKFGIVSKFKTETGNILVLLNKNSGKRPRIKAITFGKTDNSETFRINF